MRMQYAHARVAVVSVPREHVQPPWRKTVRVNGSKSHRHQPVRRYERKRGVGSVSGVVWGRRV